MYKKQEFIDTILCPLYLEVSSYERVKGSEQDFKTLIENESLENIAKTLGYKLFTYRIEMDETKALRWFLSRLERGDTDILGE